MPLRKSARSIAPASLLGLGLGLLAWPGCDSGATTGPDGPEKSTVQKIEDGAVAAEKKAGELGSKAVEATGKGLEKAGAAVAEEGKKLETSGAEAVKDKLGETAGKAAEGLGKGIEATGNAVDKGGAKLEGTVKKPE